MTFIPFLITDSLGLSLIMLGLLEGSTEFLSNVFRLSNGILFDKIKNKRIIFVTSTALAFLSKFMLLIASPWAVISAKTLERVANGTFASPRDAYVASNAKNKGMALGFLNVTKALGCILGPLIVSASTLYMGPLKDNLHFFIILCCCLTFPAFLFSFTLNVAEVKETPFSLPEFGSVLKRISPILLLTFLFFMGRFNDGLLMMYLKQKGFPEWFYLSAIAIFNSIMLITSPIVGRYIDTGNLKKAIYFTAFTLCVFNLCYMDLVPFTFGLAILGLICWGTQRACAQIVFSALVFRSVEKQHYGTAIGIFYIVSGLATMFASFICGYMANHHFQNVFIFSGIFALLSLVASYQLLSQKSKIATTAYVQ
jgi:hypothetical protein